MAIPAIGALTGSGGIGGVGGTSGTSATGGGKGFGGMLENAIGSLEKDQTNAASASQQLATGQTDDVTSVSMQVEQASLSLQLAVQVRNKMVDAYDTLFGMQI